MTTTKEVALEANVAASVGYTGVDESPFIIHCSYSSSSPGSPNTIMIQAHFSTAQAIAIMKFAKAVLEGTLTSYRYQSRASSFFDGGPNPWCVFGETLNADGTVGSMGIQEWCTNQQDAENTKTLMELDSLFKNLRVCRYEDT